MTISSKTRLIRGNNLRNYHKRRKQEDPEGYYKLQAEHSKLGGSKGGKIGGLVANDEEHKSNPKYWQDRAKAASAGGKRCQNLHPDLARKNITYYNVDFREKYPVEYKQNCINAGKAGGPLGGKRAYQLHPELFRKNMIETHKKHPELRINLNNYYHGEYREKNPEKYYADHSKAAKLAVRAQHKRPNGPETQFIKFNEKHNLHYKYTGDGSVWIGNCNPDFIDADGKKEVLDIFGVHWHKPEEVETRRQNFAKYGFTWRMLWDTDLKLPDDEILKKLNIEGVKVPKFMNLTDFY